MKAHRKLPAVVAWAAVAAIGGCGVALAQSAAEAQGVFASQSDVGSVTPPGGAEYDAASGTYTLHAAGANLWLGTDAFHFAWKKMSGDGELTADIDFPDKSGEHNEHRKALLMFRQTLDADSVYVDAAQHGVGMTSLQYRTAKGAMTQGIELNIDPPKRVRIEKRGDIFTMFVSLKGEPLHQVGASIKLHLGEPFYAGIGVCSHDEKKVETATFKNVELKQLASSANSSKPALYSSLQALSIEPTARRSVVVRAIKGHMEAPNWTRDGKELIYDQDGKMWRIPVDGGEPSPIDVGNATRCTGSHGLSPDGKLLAISCVMPDKPEVRIYIIPSGGGAPRLVTANANSYFHSWSPDGKTILFTRGDHGSLNIYAISAGGGEEKALTSGTGVSDDPDYSSDGRYIYFNSDRGGGTMQIWRMKPDGSSPEQMTSDEMNNWTPHPSQDGKSILILSYPHEVTGHPANKEVWLRILSPADKSVRELMEIVGGSGTDNVSDWAPDSQHVAFVSYQMLPEQDNGSTE